MNTDVPLPAELFWHQTILRHKGSLATSRDTWSRHVRAYRSESMGRGTGRDPVYGSGSLPDFGDESVNVESNYLFAFADTLISTVCPNNPEVDIKPRRAALEKAGKFRTALVNDFLLRENAQKKLWNLAARAVVYPRAFVKMAWNSRKRRPVLRVIGPQFIFFDQDAEDWDDIRYIIEVTVLTRAEVEKRTKKKGVGGFYPAKLVKDLKFQGYPEWLKGDLSAANDQDVDVARQSYEWLTVYEVYDLVGERFYHYAEGEARPIYSGELPYRHLRCPYFMLSFNDNLEDLGGISDAALIYSTLMNLNQMNTYRAWHARSSIPVPVVHEALLEDAEEFKTAYSRVKGPQDVLSMRAQTNAQITDVIGHTPTASLPFEWNATINELTRIVEFILGLPAYSRGAVGQSDIATELALADKATRDRNTRRQKEVYLVLAWIAKAVIALYTEFMDPQDRLPMRLLDDAGDLDVTRDSLALPSAGPDGDLPPEDVFTWDYEPRPFNADESNSAVALRKLEIFLPFLTQHPNIDQFALARYFAELLKVPNLVSEAAPAQAPMPTAPPTGGFGGTPANLGVADQVSSPVPESGDVLVGTGDGGALLPETGISV